MLNFDLFMDRSITLMLSEFAAGDKSALDEVIPLVYAELRKIAIRHLSGERTGHTLQPTALVNEAYVKLIGQETPDFQSRAHFLSVAARVMRQILIDHARARNSGKRGGGDPQCSLDEATDAAPLRPAAILDVEDALQSLERTSKRKAALIEMRFFGGLTAEESAQVLQIPVEKVRAELRFARAWLARELERLPARRIPPQKIIPKKSPEFPHF
jgi:RNA polymerase sigma factor (TIGR02999 family)